MSDKIEEYKKAKAVAKRVAEEVDQALGRDTTANDKHALRLKFNGYENFCHYGNNVLRLESSFGYYGSSSVSQALSFPSAEFLLRAINARMYELALEAVRIAEADAKLLLDAATKEAKEVLEESAALNHGSHNEARPCSQCGEV